MNKLDDPPEEKRRFKKFINEPKFLNIDGLNTTAAIKVDFFADGDLSVLICDCEGRVNLHENVIVNPENAVHKLTTMITELIMLKNHVVKAIKTGPTEKIEKAPEVV